MRLVLISVLLISCVRIHAAERIPGTRVSMEAPAGFEATTQFPGFHKPSSNASIIVNETKAPYAELVKGMTAKGFAERGIEMLEKNPVKVAAGDAHLLHVRQNVEGIDILKWMLVFGTEEESVILIATFPQESEAELGQQLKSALAAATWDPSAKIDLTEGLTFRVRETADLKIADKIGGMISLTRDGVYPQTDPKSPFLIVGPSLSEDWTVPGDKKVFARERFVQGGPLAEVEISSEKTVKFDGLSGYLLEATGIDKRTGVALYGMQCVLYTEDGYYILQAFVGVEEREKYARAFLTVLKSFERVKPAE